MKWCTPRIGSVCMRACVCPQRTGAWRGSALLQCMSRSQLWLYC